MEGQCIWHLRFSKQWKFRPHHLIPATNSDVSPVKFWRPSVPGCARQDLLPGILPPLYQVVTGDHPVMLDLNHNKRIHRVVWGPKVLNIISKISDCRTQNTTVAAASIISWNALLRLLHHCLFNCDFHISKHFTPSCLSIQDLFCTSP
jgi:hypothetical protein